MDMKLKNLIGKLNGTSRQAAARAANLCVAMRQYEVDLEHLLLALLENPASDISVMARRCGISSGMLEADLHKELAGVRAGNERTPVFSARLIKLVEQGWMIASLDAVAGRSAQIRSAHLLLALLTVPELAQLASRASPLFGRFEVDRIRHQLDAISAGSEEQAEPAVHGDAALADPLQPAHATPFLDQYTADLTAAASEGRLDPVIGREPEIRQAIDILLRRRQNNPILTGEAGVGKTAVVEGLALRIAAGDVPDLLKPVVIRALDIGLLQAGASVKGEFESRLKGVIDEVQRSPRPVVLFIDEAHTLIGAGGAAGQNDAANLLKPALARGTLRTIAATTWAEYKRYVEKDAALARRFQVVKVEEPSEALACAMLRAMVPLMEAHFGVRILDQAVTDAVRLSQRYISARQLPDKAVSVLDTACARVALGQSVAPAVLEDCTRSLERLDAEAAALQREQRVGLAPSAAGASGPASSGHEAPHGHQARLDELDRMRAQALAEQVHVRNRWEKERILAGQILELRTGLEGQANPDRGATRDLVALQEQLAALQQEGPLVPAQVDGSVVADIVSSWTGIPLGRMVADEIGAVRQLDSALRERVVGQDHALACIAERVKTARAGLEDPCKPKGVFLFVGPSGVGKTETALALADLLYGGERKLVTINMSEFQEAHSVAGLKGAPPGYVGYGEGGVLTEAVRRNPWCVILLDEAEKAHPDVMELFYQVFDKGVLDDAEGRSIDFRHCLIILTSNLGSSAIMQACLNAESGQPLKPAELDALVRPQLVRHFKPALVGRMQVVPFYPIGDEVLAEIIGMKLDRIAGRVHAQHGTRLDWDEAVVEAVLTRCVEADSGARNVDNILAGSLLPAMADLVLDRLVRGERLQSVQVSVDQDGTFRYQCA